MIPLCKPRIDQNNINEVTDTMLSRWLITGKKTKLFEQKLSQYCGNDKTLCVSSATAGLELILRWFGVGEGDEVILPAYTYAATSNVIIHTGARPVFVDVNKDDFNISVSQIKNTITEKTKVIIPVDIAGFPCDYEEIMQVVNLIKPLFIPKTDIQKKLGRILILSDAAHSLGAKYKDIKTGQLADISVFSFNAIKNLTTAEGGAIALNLPDHFNAYDVYKELSIMSLHGQTKDAFTKVTTGSWRYDIVNAGYKCNMPDILASIGLAEIDRYNETLNRRKEIFDRYNLWFSKYDWADVPVFKTRHKESSYHIYLLRIKGISENQRDGIIQNLFNMEISVNVHFVPVPMFTFYKNLGYNINNYPVAYSNYSNEITLPVFYEMTNIEIDKVASSVALAYKSVQ